MRARDVIELLVLSVLLGRFFCGWVCPGGALQELAFPINNRPGPGGKANWIKYIIWLPWLSAILGLGVAAGGFARIDPLHMTETGISVDAPMKYITYFGVVGIFLILALIFGRRAGCHTICWMAPFMVIGTWIQQKFNGPALHLQPTPAACSDCKSCNRHCPMSLDVNSMVRSGNMRNSECILCGECADGCSKEAIHLTWKKAASYTSVDPRSK